MNPPKVFISYSHDSDAHRGRVFELSEKLRSEGVDCNIDQYEMAPPDGWPRWMRNQIKKSDFVIVVCTEVYEQRYEGLETFGTGAGAKWEGAIITQQLYEAEGQNTKFIPVVFSTADLRHIPLEMRGGTWYRLDDEKGYELLYRQLTGQPQIIKSGLGKLRTLPPTGRKQSLPADGDDESLQKLKTPVSHYSLRRLVSNVNFKHRYFEHLVYKYRTYRTQGVLTKGPFTLDLEKVFISLRVGAESPSNVSPQLIRKDDTGKDFSIWDFLGKTLTRAEHHQHIVVLGGPGSGKTTLLEHLALTYALGVERRQHAAAPKLIPVLLYLRDVRNIITDAQPPNIIELIERQEFIRKLNPPPHWFETKIRQKKCLIMLDGLDEVADEAQRKRVSLWVNQQLEAYQTSFILTSRPFGYTSAPIENVGVSLEVQPFNSSEVEQFINNWYLQNEIMSQVRREDPGVREEARKKADDLVTRIKGSPPIAAMAVNPLLLTMIATIHAIRAVLPGKRVELYAEICDVLLGRREEAKGIHAQLTSIPKRAVLQVLAFELMQKKTREFTLELGCELIEGILSAVTNEGEIDPRGFIEQVQNVSGLIVEKTIGTYEFAHQSFQEYLAAVQIKAANQGALLVENIHDSWWSETIRLYAAQGDATALIRTALEKPSVVALTIASDCLEEAAIIEPEVRRQLERTLNEGIESADPLIARMAAEVKLALRLNRLERIDDNTEIDLGYVTCAEYQLFIDDKLGEGLHRQPDHWKSRRFLKGEGALPVAGVRASDAKEFCEWLSQRHQLSGYVYRLPEYDELNVKPLASSEVGAWCKAGEEYVTAGVESEDWSSWRSLTAVYARTLRHVFGQTLDTGVIMNAARNFIVDCADKVDVVNYPDLNLTSDDSQIISAINRYKAHAEFLFRVLDVNVSNVVPLTKDLAEEVGIDAALACDLLERELDGVVGDEGFDLELSRRLQLARGLARNVGRARIFAEELSRDLHIVIVNDYITDNGLSAGFEKCFFTDRALERQQPDDRPQLLLNYCLWDSLSTETKEEEQAAKETPSAGAAVGPANVRELTLGLYLCLLLVTKRMEGRLSAWEGIRIVRERAES